MLYKVHFQNIYKICDTALKNTTLQLHFYQMNVHKEEILLITLLIHVYLSAVSYWDEQC